MGAPDTAAAPQPIDAIASFHAHIYYNDETRSDA